MISQRDGKIQMSSLEENLPKHKPVCGCFLVFQIIRVKMPGSRCVVYGC